MIKAGDMIMKDGGLKNEAASLELRDGTGVVLRNVSSVGAKITRGANGFIGKWIDGLKFKRNSTSLAGSCVLVVLSLPLYDPWAL